MNYLNPLNWEIRKEKGKTYSQARRKALTGSIISLSVGLLGVIVGTSIIVTTVGGLAIGIGAFQLACVLLIPSPDTRKAFKESGKHKALKASDGNAQNED